MSAANLISTFLGTDEWQLQAHNVCYGTKNNDYGTFHTTRPGVLKGVKLKHLFGYLMCTAQGRSKWGCIWNGPRENVATEITDKRREILFPDVTRYPRSYKSWFTLPGYDGENDDTLTYINQVNPIYVEKGAELHFWFTQDVFDYLEHDNSGKHCVDVYAKISDRF